MLSLNTVQDLKNNWLDDPCWDIEDTGEGFEIFREELLSFRLETEAAWDAARITELEKRAAELGIPGNHEMVRMVERLESSIERLLDRVMKLEGY